MAYGSRKIAFLASIAALMLAVAGPAGAEPDGISPHDGYRYGQQWREFGPGDNWRRDRFRDRRGARRSGRKYRFDRPVRRRSWQSHEISRRELRRLRRDRWRHRELRRLRRDRWRHRALRHRPYGFGRHHRRRRHAPLDAE